MITDRAKYLKVLFVIALVVPQLHAYYVLETEKNDTMSTTNQLASDLQVQKQKQHERQLVQHKAIESEDETNVSYVSVSDEEIKKYHESYDKTDDAFNDVYADNHDSMFNELNELNDDNNDVEEGQEKIIGLSTFSRKRRELSDWFIAPNTRWCGRGNTAEGRYNHLGGASAADKCCRKHDHCKIYIPSMSNRYELFNYRPYTLSHCNCDRRFHTCLKMANDEDAKTIGKLFFNMVQSYCFVLRTERVCQQRAVDGSCQNEFIKQKAYLRENKKF